MVLISGPWNYGREPSGLFTDGEFGYNNLWETVGSRLTKNLNYHLPTNVDNEQMFTQLLLVGGPWFYEESGIF